MKFFYLLQSPKIKNNIARGFSFVVNPIIAVYGLVGAAVAVYGIFLIWEPFAWIVGGVYAVYDSIRCRNRMDGPPGGLNAQPLGRTSKPNGNPPSSS